MKYSMRPPVPFEDTDSKPQTTDAAFKAGKDLKEGINGRLGIDTTYEQSEATCSQVIAPNRREH